MKRMIFVIVFITHSVFAVQNGENDLEFCNEGFGFSLYSSNSRSYVNYEAYRTADRIPGIFAITHLSADTGTWITNKWVKNPLKYIKRPLTVHDKKVYKEQNKLIAKINELRKPLGIVYEESVSRKMKMDGVEKVILANNELKKSRIWLGLRVRDKYKQREAIRQIESEIEQIRIMIGNLFGDINIQLQCEYARWAQANPNLASQLESKKKMAQLENRVKEAEAEAQTARWEAQRAKAAAAAAKAAAAEASASAREAQNRAASAERHSRDLQFQQDMNRSLNRNPVW